MKDKLELLANSIAFGRLQQLTDKEISKSLGKSQPYVTMTLKQNPALALRVKELTSKAIIRERNALERLANIKSKIVDQLAELVDDAVGVYALILKDAKIEPFLRLKAAEGILDRLGVGRQTKLEVSRGEDIKLDREIVVKMKERLSKELSDNG